MKLTQSLVVFPLSVISHVIYLELCSEWSVPLGGLRSPGSWCRPAPQSCFEESVMAGRWRCPREMENPGSLLTQKRYEALWTRRRDFSLGVPLLPLAQRLLPSETFLFALHSVQVKQSALLSPPRHVFNTLYYTSVYMTLRWWTDRFFLFTKNLKIDPRIPLYSI